MRIAIVGPGRVGSNCARQFAKAGHEVAPPHALAIAKARAAQLGGDPGQAVAVLRAEPPADSTFQNQSSSFLFSYLLANALKSAGRLTEARVAYEEAVRRRTIYDQFPETVFYWPRCEAEFDEVKRLLGVP